MILGVGPMRADGSSGAFGKMNRVAEMLIGDCVLRRGTRVVRRNAGLHSSSDAGDFDRSVSDGIVA